MTINWKYYNHAMIPTTAPHEQVDTDCMLDKKFWETNKRAVFARWTTDFDCGYETNWWYIIKDSVLDIEKLSSKTKKHIKQALKKTYVNRIDMFEYSNELCSVHNNACLNYKNFSGILVTDKEFKKHNADNYDCWGIFSCDTNKLIGYMTCKRFKNYVETITAKYDPEYLNLRASDAVHYTIIDYYLNQNNYKYICSGSRNINHATNAQDYKIQTFGFRKAYCKLHIMFNPKFNLLFDFLYYIRHLLLLFDKCRYIHLVNSVLKMKEFSINDNIKNKF